MVSREEFESLLDLEYLRLSDGGTQYRIETARLALIVSKSTADISIFKDRNKSEVVVRNSNIIIEETEDKFMERLKDVSKYLHVVYKHLYIESIILEDFQEHLSAKAEFRKYSNMKLTPYKR